MAITTESLAEAILEALEPGADAGEVPAIYTEVVAALCNPKDTRLAGMAADVILAGVTGGPIAQMDMLRQVMISMVIGGYQLGLKDAEVRLLEKMAGEGPTN